MSDVTRADAAPAEAASAVIGVFDSDELVGVVALAKTKNQDWVLGFAAVALPHQGGTLSDGRRASDAVVAAAADHMRTQTPVGHEINFSANIADSNDRSRKLAERHGMRYAGAHPALDGHGVYFGTVER